MSMTLEDRVHETPRSEEVVERLLLKVKAL